MSEEYEEIEEGEEEGGGEGEFETRGRADAKSGAAAAAGSGGDGSERPPVSEFYKVVDYVTISKGGKWWSAAVETENFGRRQVALYLWFRDDRKGRWSRKQKFLINDWDAVKGAVEKLLAKKR